MLTNKFRHWLVALTLVAVAGVTAASAAGLTAHRGATHRTDALPIPSGDLGEVVVHAPRDLGEVVVTVHRQPVDGEFLAEVVVTVPREDSAVYMHATEAAATLASLQ
ncbi:MAG: hypothetical protein JSR54_02065 [Proteobacteria bacterium]|nr:hypothetical protein [Pseudomonadota bacterium]